MDLEEAVDRILDVVYSPQQSVDALRQTIIEALEREIRVFETREV